ncbi:MAG: hypothetical protein R3A78_00375 [Polyangiales bacterium]
MGVLVLGAAGGGCALSHQLGGAGDAVVSTGAALCTQGETEPLFLKESTDRILQGGDVIVGGFGDRVFAFWIENRDGRTATVGAELNAETAALERTFDVFPEALPYEEKAGWFAGAFAAGERLALYWTNDGLAVPREFRVSYLDPDSGDVLSTVTLSPADAVARVVAGPDDSHTVLFRQEANHERVRLDFDGNVVEREELPIPTEMDGNHVSASIAAGRAGYAVPVATYGTDGNALSLFLGDGEGEPQRQDLRSAMYVRAPSAVYFDGGGRGEGRGDGDERLFVGATVDKRGTIFRIDGDSVDEFALSTGQTWGQSLATSDAGLLSLVTEAETHNLRLRVIDPQNGEVLQVEPIRDADGCKGAGNGYVEVEDFDILGGAHPVVVWSENCGTPESFVRGLYATRFDCSVPGLL